MKLTDFQKSEIKRLYDNNTLDTTDLGEIVEMIVDTTIDNDIVDFSHDEDGDMYEAYTNIVWDMIESWEDEKQQN